MNQLKTHNYLINSVTDLSGVGSKIRSLLKKKKLKKYQIYCGVFRKDIQIVLIYKLLINLRSEK